MTATTGVPLLPRLLVGVGDRPTSRLECHLDLHGTLPDLERWAPEQVISMFEQAGIRGRGGASFPVAAKMRAVASRRWSKVVVANGSEGEPASKKDRALLREVPHLVLDGVALAARAVGAREAVIAISERDDRGVRAVADALGERRKARVRGEPRFDVFSVPERFISGQSSALVNAISGGPGKPSFGPRPFERGVRGRPTLVQNVETLAHPALIARHGPGWFRQLGTLRDLGSTLVTLSGAINRRTRFAVGLVSATVRPVSVGMRSRVSREDNSVGRISRSCGSSPCFPGDLCGFRRMRSGTETGVSMHETGSTCSRLRAVRWRDLRALLAWTGADVGSNGGGSRRQPAGGRTARERRRCRHPRDRDLRPRIGGVAMAGADRPCHVVARTRTTGSRTCSV